jgi:glycosyltransferase involved in cell wall biosynthesis
MIIKDGIKYGFPFEESIAAARRVSDEVIVVDGGSTDGTFEKLQQIASVDSVDAGIALARIKIEQHEWDMGSPTLFGDEKTFARELCIGTHLIQLDADEIISEPEPGTIRRLIEQNRFDDVLDLPCINFYGDTETVRIEPNFWKWRISKNDPNILHGVHKEARQMDPDTAMITMDKTKSDSCEYIYDDTMEICKHKIAFDAKLIELHEKLKRKMISEEEYLAALNKVIKEGPVIFHYSWLDLERKTSNGSFWDQTFHGKKQATHNTTKDITGRVEQKDKEILLKVDFEHPLRSKHERTTTESPVHGI